MKCRLPKKIGTPGGGGTSYPEGAFIPVTKFTAGKSYALVAKIDGVYRYINTTAFNNYTMNATEISVTPGGGYVTFGSEPALFTATASGDGFTLANGSNFLHGTSSGGTALRVGTTSAVWKVDTSETGGFESGKYLPKEVSSSVWLKNTTGGYDWSIKFESANLSFGYDRAGRDNTYSTGFVSFILYEKWEGQTGGGDSGGGGDDSLDYHDNFADNDWATIAKVCAEGLVPTTWKVGDQKAMTINGASYPIDIIGIQHDDYADGSGKAPFTFHLHDIFGTKYKMAASATNGDAWKSSEMRSTHLPSILTKMPSEVQSAIKEVNKKTAKGNYSSTIQTTADKLFLLSEMEVLGQVVNAFSGEGNQYTYYTTSSNRIKKKGGSTSDWWTRSPVSPNQSQYVNIQTAGGSAATQANYNCGVAFAFCLGNPVSGGSSGGGTTPSEYAVTIVDSGNNLEYLDENGITVSVGGTQISEAGTVSAANNSELLIKSIDGDFTWEVQVDGQTVRALSDGTGSYSHTITSNTSLQIIEASSDAFVFVITTE